MGPSIVNPPAGGKSCVFPCIFTLHRVLWSQDMSYDDSIMDFNAEAANGIVMEGYLYKRASNAFKTWSR